MNVTANETNGTQTAYIVVAASGGGTCWYECSRCETPADIGDKQCRGCGAVFVNKEVSE